MNPWGWILLYLVGFTLVQLVLFRYISADGGVGLASLGSRETSSPSAVDADIGEGRGGSSGAETGDGITCSHCGTVNTDEPTVRYCRECLTQLH